MKLTDKIFFYEGDYIDKTKIKYFGHYKGMASSNFLIIKGSDKIMIDSGFKDGPHTKRIRNELKNDNISTENIKNAIFSHSHPDHVMFAKNLAKKQDLNFFIHKDNEQMLVNDDICFETFFNFPEQIQVEIFKFPKWSIKLYLKYLGFNFEYIKVKKFFQSNEIIELGTKINTVELSSHCPGHSGFYFSKEKIFYTADLFDLRCSPTAGILSASSCFEKAISDLKKIKKYDIDILVPGHGQITKGRKNIKKLLDDIHSNTLLFADTVLENVSVNKNEAKTLKEIYSQVFPLSIAYNAFSRMIITYNILKYLKRNSLIDFIVIKNRFWWYRI